MSLELKMHNILIMQSVASTFPTVSIFLFLSKMN